MAQKFPQMAKNVFTYEKYPKSWRTRQSTQTMEYTEKKNKCDSKFPQLPHCDKILKY